VGRLHLRQHAGQDGDRAAPRGVEARAVRLRGRDGARVRAHGRVVRTSPRPQLRRGARRARGGDRVNAPSLSRPRVIDAGTCVRLALIVAAVLVVVVFALLPATLVFVEAFEHGLGRYFASLRDPEARSALVLSLAVVAIAVPLNTLFGVA